MQKISFKNNNFLQLNNLNKAQSKYWLIHWFKCFTHNENLRACWKLFDLKSTQDSIEESTDESIDNSLTESINESELSSVENLRCLNRL